MTNKAKEIADMIDILPEQEQALLFEITKRFVTDDVATEDDILAIQAARKEYENGETVSHDSIDWD